LTGKTTYLTQQIQAAADKHGMDNVFVASFTKAAAQELAGRNQNALDSIGTLHSHCYRALGHKKVAESCIGDFNREFPHLRLSIEAGATSVEDSAAEARPVQKTVGDDLFHSMGVLRARMVPYELWPQSVRVFSEAWRTFKIAGDLIDFTDMIELAYKNIDAAPGLPTVGMIDEAQDLTPLQLALVRKWGRSMEYIVVAGDDDQLIFGWLGASTDVFLAGEPDIKKVLSQSYRIPRAVHAYAERWVAQIKHREPKEYKPRDFEGEVRRLETGTYRDAEEIIKDAEQYINKGKTVMILASCTYMLQGVIGQLRKQGIVFHNPYRQKQGAWNPIRYDAGKDRISTAQRLMAYLAGCPEIAPEKRLWTMDEFKRWIEIVNSKGNLRHGAKKLLKEKSGSLFEMDTHDILEVFSEKSSFWDALDNFSLEAALGWFEDNVQAAKIKAIEFPARVIRKAKTYDCLTKKPQVIVGTVHSVKGGEAEIVYLMPDLSQAAMEGYTQGGETRDGIHRMFYVGITRARETLVLCGASSSYAVRWEV